MEHQRFWELLAKMNAGEASPEEQLEFSQAVMQSSEYQEITQAMPVFWQLPLPVSGEAGEQETSRKWDQVRRKISAAKTNEDQVRRQITAAKTNEDQAPMLPKRKRPVLSLYRMLGAAAILVAATSSAWWWSGHLSSGSGKMNIISTRYGSKSKVELPDGTQVWLNGGSRIVYKEDYDRDNREIQLEGEAFFDVVHDAARPFVIHTRDMDVRVLGTTFNVMAYPNDKTSETSLINGSIEISFPGRPADRLILKPDEKITVVHGQPVTDPLKSDPEPATARKTRTRPALSLSTVTYQPADSVILETAWTRNMLVFRGKGFDEIAQEMERWFNTSIHCTDTSILNRKFTGTFYHETVTEALDALKLSYPFHYHLDKENNVITITQ